MQDMQKIYRICDANLNRAKEGLRVVEDYFRFVAENDEFMTKTREIRHALGKIIDDEMYRKFVEERDVFHDSGMTIKEEGKNDLEKLVRANIKRAQEALRVLEEYSKIIVKDKTIIFKELRFKVYDLEKGINL